MIATMDKDDAVYHDCYFTKNGKTTHAKNTKENHFVATLTLYAKFYQTRQVPKNTVFQANLLLRQKPIVAG